MRRIVFMTLAALIAGGSMVHADFPDVSQLPSRPEMPDPLVMFDGARVASREQWINQRRPELKALFQFYMYGEMPPAPASIGSTVERVDPQYFGGKATKKEVTIAFGPTDAPKIHLLLVVPNRKTGPAPTFLGVNFCGNHMLVKDPSVALPAVWMPPDCPGCADNRATDAGRGTQLDVWAIEGTIDRGYAVATFYSGDVAPDHPGLADGVFPFYLKPGQTQPGPNDWGAVAAWAWGLMRAMDYLRTDTDIDGNRVAVVGHSRMGKAALLAGAFDDRIALTIAHQAGCGGSAPSRGTVGESVERINTRFPHWFDAEFKKFNVQTERLPFDQNALVALAAPRPVLFTNGDKDTWANPEGQFQVLRAADPVYRFLGVKGLDEDKMPAVGTLVGDRLGYHIRSGKHAMGKEDWAVFLEFADRHIGKPLSSK